MEVFWFWLIFFLVVGAVAAAPGWGYTRNRRPYNHGGPFRYYPSAVFGIAAGFLLLLVWMGIIAIALPWGAAPVAVN